MPVPAGCDVLLDGGGSYSYSYTVVAYEGACDCLTGMVTKAY